MNQRRELLVIVAAIEITAIISAIVAIVFAFSAAIAARSAAREAAQAASLAERAFSVCSAWEASLRHSDSTTASHS